MILSIPLWNKKYLRWGIFIPIFISGSWVIFDGCVITNRQTNLRGDTFVRNLLSRFSKTIMNQQADHIIFFIFMLVTVIGFMRLCPKVNPSF
jgi:hypothetical protein